MHRSLARFGALALSTALAACASQPLDASKLAAANKSDPNAAAMASTVPASLDSEIQQAQLLRSQGDYTGAVHALSQLMMVAPDDPRIVGEYGKVLAQQGRASEAVSFLTRAVELQPRDWTLFSALGVSYDEIKDSTNARVAYERALALKPGEAVVLNNYAMSRMLAGDTVQAHALLAQAGAAGAANPKIARNLALLDKLAPLPSAVAAPQPQSIAEQPPKALAQAKVETRAPVKTVMMQEVPFDPKAGPVKAATHEPRKLAAKHESNKTAAKHASKPVVKAAAAHGTIPSLRLANETP
jgi:Flp pilus assembly protein TadD